MSLPVALRQRIQASEPPANHAEHAKRASSPNFVTIPNSTSSWASTRGLSLLGPGPDRPPLAWAGVRHQFTEDDVVVKEGTKVESGEFGLWDGLYGV
jgi:hypothetical protein